MKTKNRLTWDDAIALLEKHGSTEDPVWVDGEETTPLRLSYEHLSLDEAGSTRITYCSARGRVKGTIGGMIRDRARIPL